MKTVLYEKLNNFYHLAYICRTHVIVLDQFLLHMKFHETELRFVVQHRNL